MAPNLRLRGLDQNNSINLSGLLLTLAIGVAAVIIAYATYRLHKYHRTSQRFDYHELDSTEIYGPSHDTALSRTALTRWGSEAETVQRDCDAERDA